MQSCFASRVVIGISFCKRSCTVPVRMLYGYPSLMRSSGIVSRRLLAFLSTNDGSRLDKRTNQAYAPARRDDSRTVVVQALCSNSNFGAVRLGGKKGLLDANKGSQRTTNRPTSKLHTYLSEQLPIRRNRILDDANESFLPNLTAAHAIHMFC